MGSRRRRTKQKNPERFIDTAFEEQISAIAETRYSDRARRRAEGKRLLRLFSESKAFQLAVFRVLNLQLEEDAKVLDLCSGYGIATNALVAAGKVSELELVDGKYDRTGDIEKRGVEAILGKLKTSGKVNLNGVLLRPNTELNPIPNVILSDTGLALPVHNRVQSLLGQADSPQAYRAGHIPNTRLTFGDILQMLSGPSARRLFVFDSPFHTTQMSPDEMTAHMQTFISQNEGWKIDKRRDSIVRGFPFHEAVLTYSPSKNPTE